MSRKLTQEEAVRKAKKVHDGKYSYGKYRSYKCKIEIHCPKHGKFNQVYSDHVSGGHGCPKCAIENSIKGTMKSEDDVIEQLTSIHNGKYSYGKYNGMNKKMVIYCPHHGKFTQTPNNHKKGNACPKCNISSKGEEITKQILLDLGISFQRQKSIQCGGKQPYHLDFYFELKRMKYAIEYDGKQHFQPVKFFGGRKYFEETKKRDSMKNQYCMSNSINLIRIDGRKYKTYDEIRQQITARLP